MKKEVKSNEKKDNPSIFLKYDNALVEDNSPFYYDQEVFVDIFYEAELVVKINTRGKNIPVEKASNYYDEVTVGIDLSDKGVLPGLRKKG